MILTRPFRKPFWIINSFFKKHRRLIGIVTVVVILFLLASQNLISLLPKIKPQQKIGLVGQYTLANLPDSVQSVFSRSLINLNESGEIVAGLAENWEVLEDETLYRIYLPPEIFWSDNTLIKSRDITFDIPDVTVSYPTDNVIAFKLKESFSPFLVTLTRPIIKNNQVTAGDYLIKKIRFSGPYLKIINLTGPTQNLTFRFYPSNEAAWQGFKLGEVNQLKNLISNPLTDDWQKKIKLQQSTNYHQYLAVIFNLSSPQLSNKSLRQALAYAIKEKSASPDNRAFGPISPLSWAYNPNLKPYDYNPVQAKELYLKAVEEASLSGQLEISLGTSQTFLSLAETIAKSWQEILNIKTNVRIINSIEPDFQAILVAQEIPPDPDQHALWHSTQPTNITHYSDLRVDKLLEDGRKISDPIKRKEIYLDFQRFLVEDSPAIFLQYPTIYTISRR